MNSIMIRQSVKVAALAAIVCITLLVAMFLILSHINGGHASRTGVMLIAPSYIVPSHRFVDLNVMVSTGF